MGLKIYIHYKWNFVALGFGIARCDCTLKPFEIPPCTVVQIYL